MASEALPYSDRPLAEKLAWELEHLALEWEERAVRYEELARLAMIEGDELIASNYLVLAQLGKADSMQAAREADQIARGETPDRVIPTFTHLPGEDTGEDRKE